MPIYVLVKVAAAVGASVSTRLLWHGEGLDRLLDATHASVTEATIDLLRSLGWDASTELSFNIRGERGRRTARARKGRAVREAWLRRLRPP